MNNSSKAGTSPINSLKFSIKFTQCLIRFKWQILLQIQVLLVLSWSSFIRIITSFVEYVVFLFFHLFDNCCHSFSFNREDRVSEFSKPFEATTKWQ